MKLHSKVNPPYLPETDQSSVLRLGLQALPESDWILVDEDLTRFHQHKTEQFERRRDKVCIALPGSGEAQAEFSQSLLQHLTSHHSADYALNEDELVYDNGKLRWPAPSRDLGQSSLWIQEDICLLQRLEDDFVLTAASVCSPSNWALEEKIGKTLDVIHDPVPGYSKTLSARVNRLMAGIKPGKPIQRYNWSVQTGNELLWRDDLDSDARAENYWRVERQTLLCLPETRAIVFGIRIFLHSFEIMRQHPGFQTAISQIVDSLPEEQKTYKQLHSFVAAK